MSQYQIIYADPPWRYEKTGGTTSSRGMAKNFYQTLGLDSIAKLPIPQVSALNSVLLLWCTYPKLKDGLSLMDAWGFTYFSVAFTWVKKTKNGKDFYGMGHYTRANPEVCLMGFKGKMKPLRHDIPQLLYAPVEAHSKKPDVVREKIVSLFGDLPRIELFARQKTDGWDVWGNEVKSDIQLINV